MLHDELHELRAALSREIEPLGLLSAEQLATLAVRLGLGQFRGADVQMLWSVALLRADHVSSDSPITQEGFRPIGCDEFSCSYLDVRTVDALHADFGSVVADMHATQDWTVRFHPFRVFTLYHVRRIFTLSTSPVQYLLWQPGVQQVIERQVTSLNHFTSEPEFGVCFDNWNRVCEAAIVTEPLLSARKETWAASERHAHSILLNWLEQVGEFRIREWREMLGLAAEDMDPNTRIQVLARLIRRQPRDQIKGQFGACMHFLRMAECIRRASEIALLKHLPEEDEIGTGKWVRGARKLMYGTERVFDAGPGDVRDYFTLMGLDHGIRVRCYVEGDTEVGAMQCAINGLGAVEIINLNGQFVQRGGRGLAFARSLKADFAAKVISIILVDGDVGDNLRVLRSTIRSGNCFAPFFIHSPDFEQANFSDEELSTLLGEFQGIARHFSPSDARAESPIDPPSGAGADSVKGRRTLERVRLPKSEAWGTALMKFALDNPFLPQGHRANGKRPMVLAAELLNRACDATFLRSVDGLQVNLDNGRLEPRI